MSPRFASITSNQLGTEKIGGAARLTREILQQDALAPFRGEEIQPAIDLDDDTAVDAWVRANVETAYHPAGSCRMGAVDDPLAVVDPECRVRGLTGLRVVDASIFPTLPNGNLNAPTIAGGAALTYSAKRYPSMKRPCGRPYWAAP